ncbi:hypothetical protein FQN52_005935 [Onygenales sp. PD_12]|nr:hypothetical protein FQN52_005935 [Onygenales sp. PD_12]
MRFLRCLVPLITSAFTIFSLNVHAHSQARDRIDYLSLVENPVIHTPSHRVHAHSHFDITFDLHRRKQRLKLSLEPNDDILTDGAQVAFVDYAGNVQRTESINRRSHRVFKGWSWIELEDGSWDRVGWARVTIKEDGVDPLFEGAFTITHDHHHVLLRSSYMRTKHKLDPHLEDTTAEYMVVFRDSDIGGHGDEDYAKRSVVAERSCTADNLPFNSDPNHPIFRSMTRRDEGRWGSVSLDSLLGLTRRQDMPGGGNSGSVNLRDSIGSTAGCPLTRRVALIGVATDCTYTNRFETEQAVRENVINVINAASEVYEQSFNITLGLRNLTIFPRDCPANAPASAPFNVGCSQGGNDGLPNINGRLNLFSSWRATQKDNNAFWTLMSNCASGAEVGLAWLGQLCNNGVNSGADPTNSSSQAVTGANVVVYTSTQWQVFAHEAGHTFGAVHDCDAELCSDSEMVATSQCCPASQSSCDANGRFIMNPTSGRGITQFSACTIGNICSGMGRNSIKTDCLSDNRGVVTITGSQCGNGIVEEGEDCDCGGEESCSNNQCCDAKTCKFKGNAVCDDSNEDCCRGCQFASSNTICRASTGPCDPEETCTGNTGTCPKDNSKPDGDECGDGLTCASGQCTSRDLQCKSIMGNLLDGNATYACDSDSCDVKCSAPSLGNRCSYIRQNFLDGTPCRAGGKCENGICTGSSFGNEAKSWINRHLPVVIGVAAGVGGLIVLGILGCIIRRCRRPRHRNMAPMVQGNRFVQPSQAYSGWSGPPPPGNLAQQPSQGARRGPQVPGQPRVDPFDVPLPPPAYGTTAAAGGRMPSVRYA